MQLNENTLIETMFDVMPFGVYVIDVQTMKIIHMNRVMIRLRGANYCGQICHKALYDSDTQCIFCRMNAVLDDRLRPNGNSLTYDHFDEVDDCWYQIQSKAITWPDGRVVMCVIAVDISELKETQNHLAEAHAELALKNKELELLSRHKSEFLANISHEIRTPLSAVIGLSDLTLKTDLTLKQRDYLTKIHASSNALLRILNDTLDYSKIEAGRIDLEHTPFELPQMLDEISGMFYHDASRKFIELLLFFDDKVPWFVIGDPFRLGQILSNLLSNAVKFTDAGQILIKVNLINQTKDHTTIRFAVSDTGIGISEKMLPRLFDSFTQESSSTSRKYGGSGLGLAICKKMVELMNGTIWVESKKGEGSTFTFEVDLELQPKEHHRKLSVPMQIAGLNILLADDNSVSLNVLEKMLTNFGCRVVSTDSGENALKMLRERMGKPDGFDLLITDWHMKQINGIELAEIIRKEPQLETLPIILISAFDKDGELMSHSNDAGIHAFISKPINLGILFDSLMDIFSNEKRRMGLSERVCIDTLDHKPFKGKEILLVDDNSINRQIGTELLGKLGVLVQSASSGARAVAMALRSPFDAILMDLSMPDMDGYETTTKIRQYLDKVPIIAMTAHCNDENRQLALDAGMDDYICKPIDPDLLFQVLSKTLSPGSSSHPAQTDLTQAEKKRRSIFNESEVSQSTLSPPKPPPSFPTPESSVSQSLASPDTLSPIRERKTNGENGTDPVMVYFKTHSAQENSDSSQPLQNPASPIAGTVSGPILDTPSAIKRLAGNLGLYRDLLKQYLSEIESKTDEVKQALHQAGFEHAAKLIHYIKGVSGNIGLTRVFHRAGLFEHFLMDRRYDGSAAKLPEAGNGNRAHETVEEILQDGRTRHEETDLPVQAQQDKLPTSLMDKNASAWEWLDQFETELKKGRAAIENWLKQNTANASITDLPDSSNDSSAPSGSLKPSAASANVTHGSHATPSTPSDQDEKEPSFSSIGDETELLHELRTLHSLLEANNAMAMEQIDLIMQYESVAALEDARKMTQRISSLDFDAALDLLHRVFAHFSKTP